MPFNVVDSGKKVLIARSDGRMQEATVEKVCERTGEVSVKWLENGVTKGKDVPIEELIELKNMRRTDASHEKNNASRPGARDIVRRDNHGVSRVLEIRPSYIISKKPRRKRSTSWQSSDCISSSSKENSSHSAGSLRHPFSKEPMNNMPEASKSSLLREARGRAIANRCRPRTMTSNVEELGKQKPLRQGFSPSRSHHSPVSPMRKSGRPDTGKIVSTGALNKEGKPSSLVRQLDGINMPEASKASRLREASGQAKANRSRPRTMTSTVEELGKKKPSCRGFSPSHSHLPSVSPTRKSGRPDTGKIVSTGALNKEGKPSSLVRQLDGINMPEASKASRLREASGQAKANRSRPRTMTSNVKELGKQKTSCQGFSPSHSHLPSVSPTRRSGRPDTGKTGSTSLSDKEDQVVSFVRQLDKQRAEKRRLYRNMRADIAHRKSLSIHWDILQKIESYKNSREYRSLGRYKSGTSNCKISVCIRKRPLSAKEIAREEVDVMSVPNTEHIIAHELQRRVDSSTKLRNHPFRFDYVFDEHCTNEQVYLKTARLLLDTLFNGGKATCFAYGQTGSGKTYTMGGTANTQMPVGIYGFVIRDVFSIWNGQKVCDQEVYMVASYYEIYGSKIYDLLEKKAELSIMEDKYGNVRVLKLSEKRVENADHVMKLLQLGNKTRSSGTTSANDNSSRSHAIFQLVFRSEEHSRDVSKLLLIDLAGNERGNDNTSVEKKSRTETGEINKALLVLKECIRGMSLSNPQHLPFRGSKLTHVLRDTFTDSHTKTCMIATISPGINSLDHSCDTLKYANRVRGLTINVPLL